MLFRSIKAGFPYLACLAPLVVCMGLVSLKPLLFGFSVPLTLIFCAVFAMLVTSSAVMASPVLRSLLGGLSRKKLNKKPTTASD